MRVLIMALSTMIMAFSSCAILGVPSQNLAQVKFEKDYQCALESQQMTVMEAGSYHVRYYVKGCTKSAVYSCKNDKETKVTTCVEEKI